MATEESPLLEVRLQSPVDSIQRALPTNDIYDRFTRQQKKVILTIVASTGLVISFVGTSFVPSIPQISKDLSVAPASVSLALSLSILANSIGVMFWSGYTSFYGRRPVSLSGMPFTVLGSFAVATSTNLTGLLFWRFVQAFGCSGSYAIGAAIIGDIYILEERGTAMGAFFGVTLIGLAIAPSVGGMLAQYWSWRGFQASLGVWALIQTLLLALFLPETAHPGSLGIDKERPGGSRKLFVWINPFHCLTFLRSPNVMTTTLASTFGLVSNYALLVPIAYTLGAKYGITSESLIGALFFPSGLGSFLGSSIGGYVSDMEIRRAKAERKGVWVPEDRLRALWLGGVVLTPIPIIVAGFVTTYVDGMAGLVINLVCLFANGAGVDMVLTTARTYIVDILPTQSSEAMGAVEALRSLLVAPVIALFIPSVQIIGVAATYSIVGLLALFGYFLIWLTIRYGEQMRAYVDVGYPGFDSRTSNADDTATHS